MRRGGRPRPIFLGAMLASALAHGAALAVLVVLGPTAPIPLEPGPETPPAIEVSILADPRAGAPSEADDTPAEPSTPPDEAHADQAPPPPEQPAPEQPAPQQSADASPELTDAPHPPAPPPPPPPPRAVTAPPREPPARPANPSPARTQAGATADGRDAGTTDIILGAQTAPPGVDPTALNIPPRYPPEAVRRGQQGIVHLRVLVATDGSAVTVEVAQSSGSALLDRAAREAVATWRFRPAQQTGITIPTTLPISLSFSLIDAQQRNTP